MFIYKEYTMITNLNYVHLNDDSIKGSTEQTDFSIVKKNVEVYFKNLESRIIDKIKQNGF